MEKKYLRFLYITLLCILLTACTKVMSPQAFDEIEIGSDFSEVESKFGPPFEEETVSRDFKRYTYVQRTPIGPDVVDQATYILYVCKGRIINKVTSNGQGPELYSERLVEGPWQ
jgi:hypothetical protein